ncbi:centrosomal protein of 131 kDa [Anabrus simplex]|uniref:centrosomal protein of 131 kDa n=1 Tax=Anabrus simplex TaxID=316456 RepID=UPI0035A33A05
MDIHTSQSSKKENFKVDLSLSGSQICLSSRPRTGSGKASMRSLAVTSVRSRRPVSATPVLGHQGSESTRTSFKGWRRPQSADSPLFTHRDFAFSCSFPRKEFDLFDEAEQHPIIHHRNKIDEKFPILESDFSQMNLEENRANGLRSEFGLINIDLGAEHDLESIRSDELCHSETSLGERIIAMAQHMNSNSLQPGLTTKPPLPQFKSGIQVLNNKFTLDHEKETKRISLNPENRNRINSDHKGMNTIKNVRSFSSNEISCVREIELKSINDSCIQSGERENSFANRRFFPISKNCNFREYTERDDMEEENMLPCLHLEAKSPLGSNFHEFHQSNAKGLNSTTDIKYHGWFNTAHKYDEDVGIVSPDCGDRGISLEDFGTTQQNVLKNNFTNYNTQWENQSNCDTEKNMDCYRKCESLVISSCELGELEPIEEDLRGKCDNTACSFTVPLTTDSNTLQRGSHLSSDVELDKSASGEECHGTAPIFINSLRSCTGMGSKININKRDISIELPKQNDLGENEFQENLALNAPNFDLLKTGSMNSTYDDIVNILKVLEDEEEVHPLHNMEVQETCNNVHSSYSAQSSDEILKPKFASTCGKLEDILGYLDKVDQSCDAVIGSAKTYLQPVKDSTSGNSNMKLPNVPSFQELLSQSTMDLAHEVLHLKLQLEDKSSKLNLLQETLNQQKKLVAQTSYDAEYDKQFQLKEQKQEYESMIEHHQKFIDQLIADKKSLSEQYESVCKELKTNEYHYTSSMKNLTEKHSAELHRTKDLYLAAEKLRWERWLDEKTEEIKEMAVREFEPKLQRMNALHQQEISELRKCHKQELEQLEYKVSNHAAERMQQLHEKLALEKEEAVAREREELKQKFENQTALDKLDYQEKCQHLLMEVQQDRKCLIEEESRIKEDFKMNKQNLIREHTKDLEYVKAEYEQKLEKISDGYQTDIKLLKERFEAEKEELIHNNKKKQATLVLEKQEEIRQQCKREKEREIELLVKRFEKDALWVRTEQEKATESRFRRLREKHDTEMKASEASEEFLKTKFDEYKHKLSEKDDEIINLKTIIRQFEKELHESRKIADRLSAERADLRETVKKELIHQMTLLEQESMKLREDNAALKMKHQIEIANREEEIHRLAKGKEEDLQEVYSRVKIAVAKKDETIQRLTAQHKSARQRCIYLEDLLQQQQ